MKTARDNEAALISGDGAITGDLQLKRASGLCVHKTRANIKRLADEPKSGAWAEDGNYFAFKEGFFEIGNWTSSFFTGMALLAWQQTEDEYFLQQTLRLAPAYYEKVFARFLDTHHDVGFLYTLYSVALYKLTADQAHREVGLRAAEILYRRFNHTGGFIRAWGRLDTAEQNNMAIIDCMMNLPLFYWASQESGDRKYHDVATRQADTTLKCFVRPDDSVFHAYRFDLKTGRPIGADNICGVSVDSHWARGTAWAIYGFALSYKYTRDVRYRDAAARLALKFMSLLDHEVVPVWDFRLSADKPPVRDSSALAIAVCGMMELVRQGAPDSKLFHATRPLLLRLCAEDYLSFDDNCPGVLKSAYGDKVAYSSWGDYFLMEALARERFQFEPWW